MDGEAAVTPISHEVEPATSYRRIKKDVDGRDKPGHDGVGAYDPAVLAAKRRRPPFKFR
jgi:hypothetical protein